MCVGVSVGVCWCEFGCERLCVCVGESCTKAGRETHLGTGFIDVFLTTVGSVDTF